MFAPPAALDPAAKRAMLEAQLRALDEAAAAPAPARPAQPIYYHAAASLTGRQYLHRVSPPVQGVSRFTAPANTLLAPAADLRAQCLPVREAPGSAVGYAIAALREALTAVVTGEVPPGYLSPAFIADRVAQSTPHANYMSGTSLAEEFATLATYGVCPDAFAPCEQAFNEPVAELAAQPWRIASIVQVDLTVHSIKAALTARQPIAVAFVARPSFEIPGEGGLLPMYGDGEALLGLHAVLVVGYNDQGWIVRNSFGDAWGDRGYATMPYGYEKCWREAWTATVTS